MQANIQNRDNFVYLSKFELNPFVPEILFTLSTNGLSKSTLGTNGLAGGYEKGMQIMKISVHCAVIYIVKGHQRADMIKEREGFFFNSAEKLKLLLFCMLMTFLPCNYEKMLEFEKCAK